MIKKSERRLKHGFKTKNKLSLIIKKSWKRNNERKKS